MGGILWDISAMVCTDGVATITGYQNGRYEQESYSVKSYSWNFHSLLSQGRLIRFLSVQDKPLSGPAYVHAMIGFRWVHYDPYICANIGSYGPFGPVVYHP